MSALALKIFGEAPNIFPISPISMPVVIWEDGSSEFVCEIIYILLLHIFSCRILDLHFCTYLLTTELGPPGSSNQQVKIIPEMKHY